MNNELNSKGKNIPAVITEGSGRDYILCALLSRGGVTWPQTWLNRCLWRRSAPSVQLQQCPLEGLAEGVLEVGNGDPVGAVALPVAVCRWRSEQLV